MKSKRGWVAINSLKTKNTFGSIFPRDEKMVDVIADHMKRNGYDASQPIIAWDRTEEEGRNALYIVDGHTRKCAAAKAGISPVYVARVKFKNENEALQYAIHNQRDRRNMTDGDLLKCIQLVDNRKPRGGDRKSEGAKSKAQHCANDSGKSAKETAKIVGVKQRQVEKVRTILDHADNKTKKDIEAGKKSVNKAYNEIQQKRSHQKKGGGKKKSKKSAELEQFEKVPVDIEAEKAWLKVIESIRALRSNGGLKIDKLSQQTYDMVIAELYWLHEQDRKLLKKKYAISKRGQT
jgi:ParB family chromosome partitioning protein